MSTFKEQILEDIDDVFADTDEFFEEHVVNGSKSKRLLIYVKASDFGRLPRYGNKVTIDSSEFFVTDAVNESGIYSITMEASG